MNPPRVTVVIPAYDEESRVGRCLGSVQATRYPGLEIIVVDDNSGDKTSEVAASYQVQVVKRMRRGGIAVARNEGAKAAHGGIIAFVDADCTVDVHWLDLLTSHYVDESVGGVGGVILPEHSTLIANYRSFKEREEYSDATEIVDASFLPGGNSSYRADVLRDIGGFDPAFAQPRGHEAYELGHRIRNRGFRLIGEPKAVVFHSSEDNIRAWIRTTYGSGFSSLSFLRHLGAPDYRRLQLKQTALICFIVLTILTMIRLVPAFIFLVAAAVFMLFELLTALINSFRAMVHFKSLRYLIVFPLETALRFCLYAGFCAGLIASTYRGLTHLTDQTRVKGS